MHNAMKWVNNNVNSTKYKICKMQFALCMQLNTWVSGQLQKPKKYENIKCKTQYNLFIWNLSSNHYIFL